MSLEDTTVGELFAQMLAAGGSILKIRGDGDDGEPRFGVILIGGQQETTDVWEAVCAVEDRWEKNRDKTNNQITARHRGN